MNKLSFPVTLLVILGIGGCAFRPTEADYYGGCMAKHASAGDTSYGDVVFSEPYSVPSEITESDAYKRLMAAADAAGLNDPEFEQRTLKSNQEECKKYASRICNKYGCAPNSSVPPKINPNLRGDNHSVYVFGPNGATRYSVWH